MKKVLFTLSIALCVIDCYSQDYITIENDKIYYEVKGSGEPWLILVNGSGMDLKSLDTIFYDLSKETTVLRYSRAGLGESTFINKYKDFDSMVNELELLVSELSVPEPFILGAHSFGGLIAKAFAGKNPTKVAGILSMDPSFEDNWEVLEPFEPDIRNQYQTPLDYLLNNYPDRGSTREFESMVKVYNSPETWKTWFDYPSTIPHFVITSLKISEAVNSPGRGSKEIMNARAEAQYRAIANSEIHMQIKVSDAGHEIYNDQPQLVIDAFKMLLNLVKPITKNKPH